jgi:hypothetical protein
MKTDDLPVRTGHRGAGGNWNALPDRAASQRKMIMRLDIGRKSMNAAACRRAFIGNDGALRKIMGDDLPGRERIELAEICNTRTRGPELRGASNPTGLRKVERASEIC